MSERGAGEKHAEDNQNARHGSSSIMDQPQVFHAPFTLELHETGRRSARI
jgi:hypothetical protein